MAWYLLKYFFLLVCDCDDTGSSAETCDVSTGQCSCKDGYYGKTCATGNWLLDFFLLISEVKRRLNKT